MRHRFARVLLTATAATGLLVSACSSGEEVLVSTTAAGADTSAATTEAPAPTTTLPDPALFDEVGPHPVGVTTLQLANGTPVEVWYPAVAGSTGSETYDIRDFVPEAIKALLTGDVPATYTYDAARDAEVADGAFPVVLFSHGFSGMRLQSTFLTAHLASWGMIVASPDHPSRDLANVLGATASGERSESVADLLGALDLLTTAEPANALFAGHVDAARVAALGHSAGGGTVLTAAADERIDGYVSMASGALGGATIPAKPSFFIAGTLDAVVAADAVTRPAFESAPSPSLLWILDGVGHNGFDDFCTFGGGTGIIGVAEASGLGAVLDGNASLRRLGEDGCIAPAVPVATTFPLIRHAVTGWVLHLFGEVDAPVAVPADAAVEVETATR